MRTWAILLAIATAPISMGQGFNCDLNSPFSPPITGGGVPSVSFGAAAGQAGLWNDVDTGGLPPTMLRDLSGNLTSVSITGPMGGSGGGWNVPGLNADYRALMADARSVTDSETYSFSGLAPGSYLFYVYAARPNGGTTQATVTVSTSIGSSIRTATGPMPSNTFSEGTTHTVHSFSTVDGNVAMRIDRLPGQQVVYLNGFQIVAVPEPATVFALGTGTIVVVRRRRKK